MSYWSVPAEALESEREMEPWARLAIAAAERKANAKKLEQSSGATARRERPAAARRPRGSEGAHSSSTPEAASWRMRNTVSMSAKR
jgi:hypothetical protein